MTISVRPEDRPRSWRTTIPERNALPGTVVFVRDLGELFECFVDCGVGEHVVVAGSPRDRVRRPTGRPRGGAVPARGVRGGDA